MVEDLGVRPGLTLGHPPGAVRGVDAADPAVLMVLKAEVVDQGYLGLKVMRHSCQFWRKMFGKIRRGNNKNNKFGLNPGVQ